MEQVITKELEKYGVLSVFRMKPLERLEYEFWKSLFFLFKGNFWEIIGNLSGTIF